MRYDMSLSLSFFRKAAAGCSLFSLLLASSSALASYVTNGSEYAIAGALPRDQVHPKIAISASGGLIVWDDTITDGDGLGISMMQLDAGLSATLSPMRVNEVTAGDQERPNLAM